MNVEIPGSCFAVVVMLQVFSCAYFWCSRTFKKESGWWQSRGRWRAIAFSLSPTVLQPVGAEWWGKFMGVQTDLLGHLVCDWAVAQPCSQECLTIIFLLNAADIILCNASAFWLHFPLTLMKYRKLSPLVWKRTELQFTSFMLFKRQTTDCSAMLWKS